MAFQELVLGKTHRGVIDINMSLKWQHEVKSNECIPCLVSTSRRWMLHQRRLLSGKEAMGFQGMQHSQIQGDWTDEDLIDLAGNAFNGFIFMVVMLSLLTVGKWNAQCMEC